MSQYINKSALVAEINRLIAELVEEGKDIMFEQGRISAFEDTKVFINHTLQVKEVDEQKERMEECPYRKVGCTMYEGHILECRGACSWVVDYPKLKELKTQKGE